MNAMPVQPSPDGGQPETRPAWLHNWVELFIDNLEEYAVFAIDLGGVCLTWHPGVRSVLGFEKDDFIGMPAEHIFTPNDRLAGAPADEFGGAQQAGQAIDERWHVRADGSRFWGSGIMLALRDDAGNTVGFAKIVRDRTALRLRGESLGLQTTRLEGSLLARTQQLRELASDLTLAEQRERERISQLLHDELQQQLYALQMISHGLFKRAETQQQQEELSELYTLAKTTLATTRTLVSELNPAVLKQGQLGEALLWLAEHMHRRHDLEVAVAGTQSCPPTPEALGILLFQCVHELLFNVVKHAHTDRAVLTLRGTPGHFQLEIWDEGRGFAADVLERAGPHQDGFGLQSVQRRLEPFGGVVTIASVPGNGTRVTLEVPLD